MKKKKLSNSEIKELNQKIKDIYSVEEMFKKKDEIFIIEDEGYKLLVSKNAPLFFYDNDRLVPTLKGLQNEPLKGLLKKITVDMGAVKFVSKGADIMRPGITKVEDGISKDDYVSVVDQNNGVTLSVSKTIFSGEEINKMSSGKVLKNMHFVGDKIWNF